MSSSDLLAQLAEAAKTLSVREIAGRADLSHQTVYELLAGDRAVGMQRTTQRKLERFLAELPREGASPVTHREPSDAMTEPAALLAAVVDAVDRHGKAAVARAAGLTRDTLYSFLDTGHASPPTRRKLSDAVADLAKRPTRREPVDAGADPVGAPTVTPPQRHEPSYWEGRLDATAQALDAVATLATQASAELRALVASGVLHGAKPAAGRDGKV